MWKYLNVSNSVGNIQSIVVSSQSDVCLLGSVRSHHGVNVMNNNFVHSLYRNLNLVLVGLDVNLENQDVSVLNLLHGSLRGNWRNNHLVGIHSVVVGNSLSSILGSSGQLQGLWSVETGVSSHLDNLVGVGTFQGGLLSVGSFNGS